MKIDVQIHKLVSKIIHS